MPTLHLHLDIFEDFQEPLLLLQVKSFLFLADMVEGPGYKSQLG
jgi:hypothetical protein